MNNYKITLTPWIYYRLVSYRAWSSALFRQITWNGPNDTLAIIHHSQGLVELRRKGTSQPLDMSFPFLCLQAE